MVKRRIGGEFFSAATATLLLIAAVPPAAGTGGPCAGAPEKAVHELSGQAVERRAPKRPVTVDGVVTATFLGEDELGGFFLQGADVAPDGMPAGLFVYAPDLAPAKREKVEAGARVRLRGRPGSHHGRPQLEGTEMLARCGEAEPQRLAIEWPPPDRERLEGVWVGIETPLVVTGNHELARYGSLELAPHRRAFRPTNFRSGDGPEDPDRAEERLILDDGSYRGRPDPIPHVDGDGSRRVGTRIEDLTGVVSHAFDAWRLHPTEKPDFQSDNPRPDPLPDPAGGAIRIAAFNVENYFLTLGQRGAANARELAIQRAKLLAAARQLRADLLVLVEMENRPDAPEDFVTRLAEATGQPWRLARGGDTGSDAIKVSLAYRADRLEPVTEVARDSREVHHRPPPVAGFQPLGGGDPFGVAGIHFKAKVGCPDRGDVDRGQGCWNLRRTEQAQALADYLQQWRSRKRQLPVLIAGDLNAYGGEDPARALAEAGKVDLLAEHVPWESRYTYVFRGESGYLDHLQAHPRLAERVAAVHTHPINADEPRHLEFDSDFVRGEWVRDDAYRSSDHDPIAVDLRRQGGAGGGKP